MNTIQLTREQVLQTFTFAILAGDLDKAKNILKTAREYEEMTGRYVFSSLTLRDLYQAIEEQELKKQEVL